MIEEPLVTVNILSFNRKDELRNTLTKVYEQDYKNIEVIVVDNASSDGSAEMVKSEFPKVQLIQLEKNIGIAGWNEGFKVAKGEYVLVLDDDSYPLQETIRAGVNLIEQEDTTGIIAYKIFNTFLQRLEENFNIEKPYSFIGCGAIIKKSLIEKVGGYNNSYFLYHNELDFAACSLNLGYGIKLSDEIVIHNFNSLNRNNNNSSPLLSRFRYYHFFVSQSIFFLQRLKISYAIKMMFKWLINRFLIAIVYGYYHEFLSAFWTILKNFYKYYNTRKILELDLQKKYLHLIAYVDRNFFPNFNKPSFKNLSFKNKV